MREDRKDLSERLIAAVASGDIAEMDKLIVAGADVNHPAAQGFTPLMLAAYSWEIKGDFKKGVQLLLDAGARPDAVTVNGHTALMIASIYGLTDMARMLFAAGADIDKTSCQGYTAEDMARKNGHADLVALLQKERAARQARARAEGKVKRVEEYLKERARHCKKNGFKP